MQFKDLRIGEEYCLYGRTGSVPGYRVVIRSMTPGSKSVTGYRHRARIMIELEDGEYRDCEPGDLFMPWSDYVHSEVGRRALAAQAERNQEQIRAEAAVTGLGFGQIIGSRIWLTINQAEVLVEQLTLLTDFLNDTEEE